MCHTHTYSLVTPVILYYILSPTDGEAHYSRVVNVIQAQTQQTHIIAKTPRGISNVMFVHLPWAFMSLQSNAVTVEC